VTETLSVLGGPPSRRYRSLAITVGVVALVGAGVLLLRRRAPAVVLGVLVLLAAVEVGLVGSIVGFDLAAAFAIYTIAANRSPREAWFGLGGAVLIAAAALTLWGSRADRYVELTGYIIIVLIGLAIGTSVRNRRQHVAELVDRGNRLARENAQHAELASAAERARIAREMHDVVAHSLSVMIALADGASAAIERSPDRAQEAIDKGLALPAKSQRERDYLEAIAAFYGRDRAPFRVRAVRYEEAMEKLAAKYPEDKEASIFYALALNIASDPMDKTFAKQLKAAQILEPVFVAQPDHPGVAHYLIHSYDYPPIAQKGLPAARRYSDIAPDAAHALHMPSHIFTRVGAWEDSLVTNKRSEQNALANKSAQDMHHALDYQVYAALQLARDREAREAMARMKALPPNPDQRPSFYALASVPARIALERGDWAEATKLVPEENARFPYVTTQTHYARMIGAARGGNPAAAEADLRAIARVAEEIKSKDPYWFTETEVQRLTGEGWIAFAKGDKDAGLRLMRSAADMEDGNEKSSLTPARMLPARELLGDMLLAAGQPREALVAYETSQQREPNRYRGLYGAGQAAAQSGDHDKARHYFSRLIEVAGSGDLRPDIEKARRYLAGE